MHTFLHYDKVTETIVEPLDSLVLNEITVDIVNPASPSLNVVTIAGVPIGTDAPPSTDLVIAAPIAPVDGNALRLTGVSLSAQYGDSTRPGILSLATQDITGQKRFATGIRTNDIEGTGIMSVGTNSTGLILEANGDIDTDGTGVMNLGTIQSTGVNIGRIGTNTTIFGTSNVTTENVVTSNITNANITNGTITTATITTDNISTANITTANVTNGNITTATITTDNVTTANITTANITNSTISGTANIATIDRAGPISIGPTNCTALNLGRAAITTTINGTTAIGTENVTTSNITTANITTANITNETVSGTADINNLDRVGAINVGTTNATSINVGSSLITTRLNCNVQTTFIDSLNNPGAMVIGSSRAQTMQIGNNLCIITFLAQTISFPRFDCDNIRGQNAGVAMNIGTNSNNGMNLGAGMGAMVIDHFTADASDTISIGGTRSESVSIGRTGRPTTVVGTLAVNGGSTITNITESTGNYTAGGALPNTANFAVLEILRINNKVSITWRPLQAGIAATSTAGITFTPALPVGFRPAGTIIMGPVMWFDSVAGNLGSILTITSAGAMTFQLMNSDFISGSTYTLRGGHVSFPLT